MNWNELTAPFHPKDIQWRAGATNNDKTKAMALAYIDARAVMERLDEVCGVDGWQSKVEVNGAVITAGIGIKANNEWIWKWDGSGQTDFEGEKGGISGALKRAAVHWGIGRYLYNLPGTWVECEKRGNSVVLKTTPSLPQWAIPGNVASTGHPQKTAEEHLKDIGIPAEPNGKRPLSPEKLKAGLEQRANEFASKNASDKMRNFIASMLNQMLGDDLARKAFLYWLINADSMKTVPSGYVYALSKWIDADDEYQPNQFSLIEAKAAYNKALEEQGQLPLEGVEPSKDNFPF